MTYYINANEWLHLTYPNTHAYDIFIHHFINDRDNQLYFLHFKNNYNINELLTFRNNNEIFIHPRLFNYFKEWLQIYISIQRMSGIY